MILSATLIRRPRTVHECATCDRPISGPALRLYSAIDAGDTPGTCYVHPAIEEVDEIRACAPDHPKVRAALVAAGLA